MSMDPAMRSAVSSAKSRSSASSTSEPRGASFVARVAVPNAWSRRTGIPSEMTLSGARISWKRNAMNRLFSFRASTSASTSPSSTSLLLKSAYSSSCRFCALAAAPAETAAVAARSVHASNAGTA